MQAVESAGRTRRARRVLLLALNLAVRAAIVFWLAEAWVLQDDPRFAGKAIPERNTVIVGGLSLLFPAIWFIRRLDFTRYPLGLDIAYLSIFALDMAGNSFNLYDTYTYFNLVPHFLSTGVFSLVTAVYWARTRHPGAADRPGRRWLVETTIVAAGIATMVHVALEAQEYWTDVLAGTANVGGAADTVNDLAVGLAGALIIPPLAVRWFLGHPGIGWPGAGTLVVLVAFAAAAILEPGPRIADAVADRFARDATAGSLDATARASLLRAAEAHRAGNRDQGEPLRHAHASATVSDLLAALERGDHSIEGDVGVQRDLPVMRHDPRDAVELTFDDWLAVMAAADFEVVKIDVKRDLVGPIRDALHAAVEQHGLDACNLKLNADVLEGPGAYADFTFTERVYTRLALKLEVADLLELSQAFPCATVSVSAWTGPTSEDARYLDSDIRATLQAVEAVRAAGAERVVVAARWDLLSDEFVNALVAADIVIDVWTSTTVRVPEDPAAEAGRLRARYGDALGVIDLRR